MNSHQKQVLRATIESTASPQAKHLAKTLAATTTLAGRFDLTDVSKLESFLLGVLWMLENDTNDVWRGQIPLAGKDPLS